MDKTTLVESDVRAGLTAVKALEAAGLPIAAAMWLRLQDSSKWQLYITSPDVETYGPTTVNRFIDRILLAIKSPVSLDEVTAANTTNHFVNKISPLSILKAGRSNSLTLENNIFRFGNGAFDGVDVAEGVVYKIAPGVKASKEAPKPDVAALKKARALAA
ncbi:hypothetical protein [Mesorhizobium sp. WSM4906]|uniref:hypothetical protein n=1 Tax=Mesorhizobium sp. WSM4906 TaxID=3038546 RepID=UPI002416382A|nr:hypothetical protein [Mesorhizobium sp. WSM4906]WFP76997.1 hypothetical protein QAZ22_03870 [Mesorhizobium sp. WSM4906]